MKPIEIRDKILEEISKTDKLDPIRVQEWGKMLDSIENDGNYVRFKTAIRKAIKIRFFNGNQYEMNNFLYPLKFDNSARTIKQNKLAAKNQVKAHNNVFHVSMKKYGQFYLLLDQKLKDQSNPPEWLFIMICFLCGCRIGEAVYYSIFEYDKDEHEILQQRILKRRSDRDVAIKKPVLLDVDPQKHIVELIKLRKTLGIVSFEESEKDPQKAQTQVSYVLNKVGEELSDMIKHIFGAIGSTHDLRKIYAYLASESDRRPPNTSMNIYREYLLGHQRPKLDNYMSRF